MSKRSSPLLSPQEFGGIWKQARLITELLDAQAQNERLAHGQIQQVAHELNVHRMTVHHMMRGLLNYRQLYPNEDPINYFITRRFQTSR